MNTKNIILCLSIKLLSLEDKFKSEFSILLDNDTIDIDKCEEIEKLRHLNQLYEISTQPTSYSNFLKLHGLQLLTDISERNQVAYNIYQFLVPFRNSQPEKVKAIREKVLYYEHLTKLQLIQLYIKKK